MTKVKKYRPAFSSKQISLLAKAVEAYKTVDENEAETKETLTVSLAVMSAKIGINAIVPAYSAIPETPKKLEIPEGMAKETFWELCYKKLCSNPDSISVAEKDYANEHRYLHNLMTETERVAFEEKLFNL